MIAKSKFTFSYSTTRMIGKGHPMEIVAIHLDEQMASGIRADVKGLTEGIDDICLSLVIDDKMTKWAEMETIKKLLRKGETQQAWLALEMQLLTEQYNL